MGGRTWVRVEDTNDDCAKWLKFNPAAMRVRHRALNDETKEVDVHDDLTPVSSEFMLDIVRFRANEANDNRPCGMKHTRGFLACLHGGSQFKEGTGLWATTQQGMMPHPNFGRRLDKGRFDRMLRHLARGPGGCEDANGPWHAIRPWVGGHNKTRKREFQWGWCAVVDETMFAWRGKGGPGGMPHVSHVPRKPEDLGCELKTVCDGTSGVMMFMEIQEGQARTRRKQWHQEHGATTSCTLRCAKEPGFAEAHRRPEERGQRAFLGDSWFAGVKTTMALEKELGCKFLGPVKTSTAGFPQERMRHTLHGTERGTTVVFEERDDGSEPTGRCAIGWNDHCHKGFMTNHVATWRGTLCTAP